MKAMTPSAELAAVIGATPVPRTEVVSKLWIYIKKHGLQDSVNKRNINADDKLKAVFGKKTSHHVRIGRLDWQASELSTRSSKE